MKYELQQNLGLDDAKHCNKTFSTQLSTDADDLKAGTVVNLNDDAVKYLKERKGYTALLEPAGKITGDTEKPKITAPAK